MKYFHKKEQLGGFPRNGTSKTKEISFFIGESMVLREHQDTKDFSMKWRVLFLVTRGRILIAVALKALPLKCSKSA